jgi:hypothetical protein
LKNALAYYSAGAVAVNSKVIELAPGPNPTTSIYNETVVIFYKATDNNYLEISLVYFRNV